MSRPSTPVAGPASIACPPHPAHQEAVLLARFSGHSTDVSQLGSTQGAEEAGLAILMAREEAVVGDYQAARDAGAGSYPLGDDLGSMGGGREGQAGALQGWSAPRHPASGANQPHCPALQRSSRLCPSREYRGWPGDGGSVCQATGGPKLQGGLLGWSLEVLSWSSEAAL